jgi:hypothetical protein
MTPKAPWLLLGQDGVTPFTLAPAATKELSPNVERPYVGSGSVGVGVPVPMTLTLTAIAP